MSISHTNHFRLSLDASILLQYAPGSRCRSDLTLFPHELTALTSTHSSSAGRSLYASVSTYPIRAEAYYHDRTTDFYRSLAPRSR